MKSSYRWLIPSCSALVAIMLSVTGCNSDDNDSPADTTATNTTAQADDNSDTDTNTNTSTAATTQNVSLTGNWYFKHEVMKLKQSGASLQGGVYAGGAQDPANPIQVPVPVVGSVSASGVVKLSELIIYTLNPASNYNIDKVGGLSDPNTLALRVTKGQAPATQIWVRK